ncbi:MAG: hypothetical protein ACM3SY_03730 [Candidatus Omnitrophota bacterium]
MRRHAEKLKWIILGLLVLLSLKPLLFTVDFIRASFTIRTNPTAAGAAMGRLLAYKPSAYRLFNEHFPLGLENHLIKDAVYHHDRNRLGNLPGLSKFSDNFYLQHVLGNLNAPRIWQHLDDVSLDLLIDPRMNDTTMGILRHLAPKPDEAFFKNLADFTWWKGNERLTLAIMATFLDTASPRDVPFRTDALPSVPSPPSPFTRFATSDNLIRCGDFENPRCVETEWFFSRMANAKAFGRGSFTMGMDHVKRPGSNTPNTVIRLMGFYAGRDSGKSLPRAGARVTKRLPAENGFYVFRCDYYLHTGSEAPSIWLAAGLSEVRLPAEPGKWKRVVMIVNNTSNQYEYFQPLVRMWGTGTLLLDQVYFGKIKDRFSIPEPSEVVIADCGH